MLAIRYLLWMLWFITNCDILGGEPFLGPSSFLCPIEKIWRIDCHNFPTKGTNINQYFRVNNRQDWWFEQRKKIIVEILQKKKHFNALHLSLYWTSCHKSHLNSKERGHKDENWKATHPTSCPKVLKIAQNCPSAPRAEDVPAARWLLEANWQLGPSLPPSSNPLTFPPSSLSLTNSWSLHGNLFLIQHLKWNNSNNQSWSQLLPPSNVYCTFPLCSSSHQDRVCCSKHVNFPHGVFMHMLQ